MNRSVPRRLGWRIAVALASVVALLAAPAASAAADDGPQSSFVTVGTATLSSTPVAGDDVFAFAGTWTPTPDSFSYQWYLDGEAVDGSTSSIFYPTTAEMGQLLSVTVTAHLTGYASTASESSSAAVLGRLSETGAAVSGSYALGQVITVSPGTWTPSDPALTYVWRTRTRAIIASGPDQTSITLTSADEYGGSVGIYASYPGYQDLAFELSFSAFPPAAESAGEASVTGTAEHGHLLTASTNYSTWYPPEIPSFSYQWNRNGQPIPGATQSTHVVAAADVGVPVTVTMTGAAGVLAPVSSTSPPVVPTADDRVIPVPTISGTAEIGEPLTAATPPWLLPAPKINPSIVWYVNGIAVQWGSNTFYPSAPWEVGGIVTVVTDAETPTGHQWSDASLPTLPVASGTIHPVKVDVGYIGVDTEIDPYVANPIDRNWISYVIDRDGVPVSTNAPYTPTLADWHHHISVAVTETVPGVTAVTTVTKRYLVRNGYFVGNPTYTHALTVDTATRLDFSAIAPTPTAVSVRWYVGPGGTADPIIGRGSTFTSPARFAGHYVYACYLLTAAHINFNDDCTYPTRVKLAMFPDPGIPGVTGFPSVGATLAVSGRRLEPVSGESVTYQWFEQTSAVATPAAIPRATSSTIILSAAQLGQLISVRVTLRASGFHSVTAQSSLSGVVTARLG